MIDVVVNFDYDAQHDDEISLRQGDTIQMVIQSALSANAMEEEEDGWATGVAAGKRGMFPRKFVQVSGEASVSPPSEPTPLRKAGMHG